jgi:hypothetical protein
MYFMSTLPIFHRDINTHLLRETSQMAVKVVRSKPNSIRSTCIPDKTCSPSDSHQRYSCDLFPIHRTLNKIRCPKSEPSSGLSATDWHQRYSCDIFPIHRRYAAHASELIWLLSGRSPLQLYNYCTVQ